MSFSGRIYYRKQSSINVNLGIIVRKYVNGGDRHRKSIKNIKIERNYLNFEQCSMFIEYKAYLDNDVNDG